MYSKEIIKVTVTDWIGNILHEFEDSDCLERGFEAYNLYEDDEDIFFNAYDSDNINHGIRY